MDKLYFILPAALYALIGMSSVLAQSDFEGTVLSSGLNPVKGATVHLVPVDLINMTKITGTNIFDGTAQIFDEPLEDSIRQHGASLPQGITNEKGEFSIGNGNIKEGQRYFIHVTPHNTDSTHLPGGDKSRKSYTLKELQSNNTPMKISLSSRPPDTATFRGSTSCLSCHDKERHPNWHFEQTGHKLGWSVPGKPSAGQDFSRFPHWLVSLAAWKAVDNYEQGTHLELGGNPKSIEEDLKKPLKKRKTSIFRVRESGDTRVELKGVYVDAYLWQSNTDNKYYITLVNRKNLNDHNSPLHLPIELIYGGGVHRQRFIVSVPKKLADQQGHYTLLQFNPDGRDSRFNPNRRVWRDYKLSHWWNPEKNTFRAPGGINKNANAIEAECAGCHVTGAERYKDGDRFLIRGVDDPHGAFDIDDDDSLDEVNVGCESCHGPGSKHNTLPFSDSFKGPFFTVNPALLSAERSDVICGKCHDRRTGAGEFAKTQAINLDQEFILPGESRDVLIKEFSHPEFLGPDPRNSKNIWPDDLHSKSPRQQYSEHIKSAHYKNGRQFVSCADCHDAHGSSLFSSWLKGDPNNPESDLCQTCHNLNTLEHMWAHSHPKLNSTVTTCIDCHMVGTSKPGGDAGAYGLFVKLPPFANADEEANSAFWQGNINSHVFDVPKKTNIGVRGKKPNEAMPIPYTKACGVCHDVKPLVPKGEE